MPGACSVGTVGDYVLEASARPSVNPPPLRPSLAPDSDTGISANDRVTRFDNSTPAAALSFVLEGTAAGNTVRLYIDGASVGEAPRGFVDDGDRPVETQLEIVAQERQAERISRTVDDP